MEIIKGNITGVQAMGQISTKHGPFFKTMLTVQTQNGAFTGELLSKGVVGQESIGQLAELEMTNDPQYGVKFKKHYDKPYNPQGQGQGQSYQSKAKGSNNSFALSYAKDLVVADRIPLLDMFGTAKEMLAFLDTGNVPLQNVPNPDPAITDTGGQANPDWVGPNPEPPDDEIPFSGRG